MLLAAIVAAPRHAHGISHCPLAARVTVHINVGRAFLYCLPTVNHSASVLSF